MNKLYKIKFNYLKLKNNIYTKTHKLKGNVIIVTSNEYLNKLPEDFFLKDALNKLGINAKIRSWETLNNLNKDDVLIIKSIWGFNKKLDLFKTWLNYLKENNIKVFNSIDIINNNYDKEIQFKLLDKYNIKHVETLFTNNLEEINEFKSKFESIVIKPTISESGYNTYKINKEEELPEITSKEELMVQPFLKSINDGEISVIYVNNKLINKVKRYVSLFTNKNKVEYIENLDNSIIEICNKVLEIKEYSNNLFMRIDLIKENNEYLVMEVELIDPNLFINCIPDKNLRKDTYTYIANIIKNKIK